MAINNLGTMASYATKNSPTFTGTVNWAGAVLNAGTTNVATSQTTTSTSYTDLATSGPAVTLTTGTKALILFTVTFSNSTTGNNSITSYAVSGATTIAASDSIALVSINQAGYEMTNAYAQLLTGLTAGSNTFTLKYRSAQATTATFRMRYLTVIDLGS